MSQSLAKVNLHIVFSTKHGQKLIKDEIRQELHSYIIGTLANLHSYTYELYANPDHIHILTTLSRTITMANLVSKIKTSSSGWLKLKGIPNFDWQDGYAVFSVSDSIVETARQYIMNQQNHHHNISFKEELRQFFRENGIDFDERFVWD